MPDTSLQGDQIQQLVIVGAGGQARAIISLISQINSVCPRFNVIGVVDINYHGQAENILDVPVLGGAQVLHDTRLSKDTAAFVAMGDNEQRRHWFENLLALEFQLPNIVSPHAYVDSSARLGQGNMIGVFAYVGPQCKLGDNNIVNTRATLEHETLVGSHSHLAPGTTIGGRCVIASNVLMGLCSVALPGTEIPEHSRIGANACVVRSPAKAGTYVGTPARQVAS